LFSQEREKNNKPTEISDMKYGGIFFQGGTLNAAAGPQVANSLRTNGSIWSI